MVKLGLLHTVKSGYLLYEPEIRKRVPDACIYTILDDYLSQESGKKGYVTVLCKNKVLTDCRMLQECGVDLIVCACSSMSPAIPDVRGYLDVPLVSVDELMIRTVVENEREIVLFATAYSASNAVSEAIAKKAKELSASVRMEVLVCDEAGEIVRAGADMAEHDQLALAFLDKHLDGKRPVVFAQSSNAHLAGPVAEKYGVRTYTNLEYCLADMEQTIRTLQGKQ